MRLSVRSLLAARAVFHVLRQLHRRCCDFVASVLLLSLSQARSPSPSSLPSPPRSPHAASPPAVADRLARTLACLPPPAGRRAIIHTHTPASQAGRAARNTGGPANERAHCQRAAVPRTFRASRDGRRGRDGKKGRRDAAGSFVTHAASIFVFFVFFLPSFTDCLFFTFPARGNLSLRRFRFHFLFFPQPRSLSFPAAAA